MPTRFALNACLSIAAVAAPLAIAVSSSAVFAETVEPTATVTQAVQVVVAPALPAIASLSETPAPEIAAAPPQVDRRQAECIAKIILHEAAYEPRQGRVAVAQVVHARTKDGRFAANACAVARQRGQFFDIDAFEPARDAKWDDAVAIATDTLNGDGEAVAPGALFFHAAYSPMPGRQRVAQIGGHVFYR